jgi:WD40 repeat protein
LSVTTAPEEILTTRGTTRNLEAYVTACSFDRSGAHVAFALGDGSLHIARPDNTENWARIEVHEGAILALAQHCRSTGFVTGGDDGAFRRIGADGTIATIHMEKRKWVEQAVSFSDGKAAMLACGIGKSVHLFHADGTRDKTLDHPSTVTGIAFDAKGKRIAASHYNGASLWFTAATTPTPRKLEWKGSHTGVAIHPAGEAVVTAMQENALHGWRLSDGQHMRMSGYPAKPESLGFTRSGKWLASGGADVIVLWPFFGGGPMGKPPIEIAKIEDVLCTRVACHPRDDFVAAGYSNGTVILADIATQRLVLVTAGQGSPISALAWSPSGAHLALGTEQGLAGIVDLSARR